MLTATSGMRSDSSSILKEDLSEIWTSIISMVPSGLPSWFLPVRDPPLWRWRGVHLPNTYNSGWSMPIAETPSWMGNCMILCRHWI